MFRMNGILRMQEQFAGYVQDERYDAVPGMAMSGYVQDVRYGAVPRMARSAYVQDERHPKNTGLMDQAKRNSLFTKLACR